MEVKRKSKKPRVAATPTDTKITNIVNIKA